jgi:hypothetical protein
VALECLQNLKNPESKFTVTADRHTFNFLVFEDFSERAAPPRPGSRSAPHPRAPPPRAHPPRAAAPPQPTWWSPTRSTAGRSPSPSWSA